MRGDCPRRVCHTGCSGPLPVSVPRDRDGRSLLLEMQPGSANQLTIISMTLQKGEDLIIGRHLREIPRDAKW